MTGSATPASQRVDQWLWHARFFKTRSLAAKITADGQLRLSRNGETSRVGKSSQSVMAGDILTFTKSGRLRIIEILTTATRRGPASEAQALYRDHSPPPPPKEDRPAPVFDREKGAGRPTKKDRRALDSMRSKTDA